MQAARRWSLLAAIVAATFLVVARPAASQDATAPVTTAAATTTTAAPGSTALSGRLELEGHAGFGGVRIETLRDDRSVGTATTAADGSWTIPLPGPGQYTVRLDVSTLPEGVYLANPDADSLDVSVQSGRNRVVLFQMSENPGGDETTSGNVTAGQVLNQVVDGLRFGIIIALASMGLSLIFGVTGLINFAHGEIVTLGAFVVWMLNADSLHLTLIVATVVGIVVMGLVGAGFDLAIFRPLRRRRLSNIALIVVTIGLGELMRNLFQVVFGLLPRSYETYAIQRAGSLGPITMTPRDLGIVIVGALVLVATALVIQYTRLGTAMRAVADNKNLAAASGIDTQKVITKTWIMGTILATLGGVFLGMSQKVQWDMGLNLLLFMFAAVVVGGLGTAYGPVLGGLLLGIVTQVAPLVGTATGNEWFQGDEFRFELALAALILTLLFRPQGILGRRERIG
ncbi:MAG: branched-chain amino acid ABC transporter permease [Acidimicrobiia bacterium]